MDQLINGGWVMVVILGCSVTALAIIIQKAMALRQTASQPNFIQSVKTKLTTDSTEVVIKELQYSRHVLGQLAAKSLEYWDSSDAALIAEIQQVSQQDVKKLQSKMSVLSIIITAAPVLGLLGTVLGLMDVFSVIALKGAGQAELLSAGISKALITTVAGLSLSIPLMFIYQYLQSKINHRLDEWDSVPQQLVAFCKQRATQ